MKKTTRKMGEKRRNALNIAEVFVVELDTK